MITVFVCITCGHQSDNIEGGCFGEQFADRVEEVLQAQVLSGGEVSSVRLQRTKCLMACERSCAAALHQDGKYSYVFGEFSPDKSSAKALLEFAAEYRVSDTGEVPFKDWPDSIKGHFVARIPPVKLAADVLAQPRRS